VQVQRTKIDRKRAEALLFPIAAFLLTGGLDKRAAQDSFASAIKNAQSMVGGRRIDHIGHPTHYADIVGRWAHDKRFVDDSGRPRRLALRGRHGFAELVREVNRSLNPRSVLSVLTRYGNVRKTRGARYVLARPFFFTSARRSMAFEPMAYFLADASSTLGRILKRTRRSRGAELFWRKVECTGLSEKAAKSFTAFARDRSLDFLEELDDWLEARRASETRRRRTRLSRRIGLGLFSIQSDAETSNGVAPLSRQRDLPGRNR
jgi:Family of unknown function (DUF6502)